MNDQRHILEIRGLTADQAERLRRELEDRGLEVRELELPAEPPAEPILEEIEHKDRLR